jgi:hypothetical protein
MFVSFQSLFLVLVDWSTDPGASVPGVFIVLIIGLTAGLHAALYGAYKDSPHESFLLRRFVRELVFATVIAGVLGGLHLCQGQPLFIIYLSIFALARVATEFWKLFLRVEPQDEYRIPTQIHWVKGVVFEAEPRKEPFGTVAVFRDLYGNRWDLIEPATARLP